MKKIENNIVTDVTCDMCGSSCKIFIDKDHQHFNLEYMMLKTYWGFGSSHDLELWEAQICQTCVDTKLKDVKFNISEYNPFGLGMIKH